MEMAALKRETGVGWLPVQRALEGFGTVGGWGLGELDAWEISQFSKQVRQSTLYPPALSVSSLSPFRPSLTSRYSSKSVCAHCRRSRLCHLRVWWVTRAGFSIPSGFARKVTEKFLSVGRAAIGKAAYIVNGFKEAQLCATTFSTLCVL